MSLIAEPKPRIPPAAPGVLVVDDDAPILEMIEFTLKGELGCRVFTADSIRQARRILATQPVELMVTDLRLSDGDGMGLLKALQSRQPLAETIVITGDPSVDQTIDAMRQGAADLLAKPFTAAALVDRARKALERQASAAKDEGRIDRLRAAVKRLNEARRMVCKKVDLLCNDLVGAYGELARQLDQVRTTEDFRHLMDNARDLEQLLCHAMDWMLRQIGHCNIAVWLAGEDQFQLGAYMKQTIAGDAALVEAMQNGLLRRVVREGFIQVDARQALRVLSSAEAKLMPNQGILASHCTYLGGSLAAIILFREDARPFSAADAATIKAISPLFAVSLAAAVRVESNDESDLGPEGSTDQQPNSDEPWPDEDRREADWWKHGEAPPF